LKKRHPCRFLVFGFFFAKTAACIPAGMYAAASLPLLVRAGTKKLPAKGGADNLT
jgi:hypothetical protein